MRDNFEQFGGYNISLDAMMRPINDMKWPYVSISKFNDLNSVCVACESIVYRERVDAYNTMLQFVLENTNKRTSHDINVVAADRVLNQEKSHKHTWVA